MAHQLVLLLVIASSLLNTNSVITPCTVPTVSFNIVEPNQFIITGPCPNNITAPVGSTVQYRCEYEDMNSGYDSPYWHIAELNGTPFLSQLSYESVSIGGSASSSNDITTGYTIIDIPVKEQYLNNTLNIQCGLCLGQVCLGNNFNMLSKNIISSIVRLVSFG